MFGKSTRRLSQGVETVEKLVDSGVVGELKLCYLGDMSDSEDKEENFVSGREGDSGSC